MPVSGKILRAINTSITGGDRFGSASSSGVLGNGGNNADGVAVFNVSIFDLTSSTVPIDAIFYGTGIGTTHLSNSNGLQLPINDVYSGGKVQSNSYRIPFDPTTSNIIKATSLINIIESNIYDQARIWSISTPSNTSSLSIICPCPSVAIGAARYRNFRGSGGGNQEQYVGVPSLNVGSRRSSGDITWTYNTNIAFNHSYNTTANSVYSSLNSQLITFTGVNALLVGTGKTFLDIDTVSITVTCTNTDSGSTITLSNLVLGTGVNPYMGQTMVFTCINTTIIQISVPANLTTNSLSGVIRISNVDWASPADQSRVEITWGASTCNVVPPQCDGDDCLGSSDPSGVVSFSEGLPTFPCSLYSSTTQSAFDGDQDFNNNELLSLFGQAYLDYDIDIRTPSYKVEHPEGGNGYGLLSRIIDEFISPAYNRRSCLKPSVVCRQIKIPLTNQVVIQPIYMFVDGCSKADKIIPSTLTLSSS
jgi:hypothetical protein